jgi:chromosome segregation ATPase
MSMAGSDVTVEILKDIRDEIRGMRGDTNERLDATNKRLDAANDRLDTTNHRLDMVETTLLDLAQQQRFVVRYTKVLSERDSRIDVRVTELETRVDKLESK